MSQEYSVVGSSARASSETANGSAPYHQPDDFSEKETLMDEASQKSHRRSFWVRNLFAFCIHLAIFLTYTILATLALDSRTKTVQQSRNLLYSPANEVLRWQLHQFHSGDGHEGPYSGYPRPELEEAWENLLGNMNVRLSLKDLKAFNREEDAVQLPDGSGYAGTLNIYHEIHCVKWMHTYMYQEHYYPNLDDAQREENRLHSEHCLNHLRKSAICHGDVGIVTYKWGQGSRKPYAAATSHQCIDFDALTDWTNNRTIDMFKPGFLVHPTLGPVYNEGEGKGLME